MLLTFLYCFLHLGHGMGPENNICRVPVKDEVIYNYNTDRTTRLCNYNKKLDSLRIYFPAHINKRTPEKYWHIVLCNFVLLQHVSAQYVFPFAFVKTNVTHELHQLPAVLIEVSFHAVGVLVSLLTIGTRNQTWKTFI